MLWKDKYELEVPLIDEQHKELFERVDYVISISKEYEENGYTEQLMQQKMFLK